MAKAKKPEGADASSNSPTGLPTKIKMTRPHGFVDEETGESHYWHINQEVFEPADIALLIERGADFEVLEGPEPAPCAT